MTGRFVDPGTLVKEIMTRELITVLDDQLVTDVANIFEKEEIHHIPVVDTGLNLLGIISKSDFLKISHGINLFRNRAHQNQNKALYKSLLTSEIMTRKIAFLKPDDPVSLAVGIFRENLFHALPVVEGKKLVGIVTPLDIINMCFS
jgi:CBS domain-containing protein